MVTGALSFLLPSSRASPKMPRSPRLAHKRLLEKGKRKKDSTDNRLSYYETVQFYSKRVSLLKLNQWLMDFASLL